MRGTVLDWRRDWGFITPDDSSRHAFVHFTDIISPEDNGFRILHTGQIVDFDIEQTSRGPRARNVRILFN